MSIDKRSWQKETEQIIANRLAGGEESDASIRHIEAVVTLSKNGEQTILLTRETPVSVEATESLSIAETQQRLMSLAQLIVDDLKADLSDSFDVSVRITETRRPPGSSASQIISYDGSAFNDELKASPVIYLWHKYQSCLDVQPLNVNDLFVLYEEVQAGLTVKDVSIETGSLEEQDNLTELQSQIGLDTKYRIIKAYRTLAAGTVTLSWTDEPTAPSKPGTPRIVWDKRFFFKVT